MIGYYVRNKQTRIKRLILYYMKNENSNLKEPSIFYLGSIYISSINSFSELFINPLVLDVVEIINLDGHKID